MASSLADSWVRSFVQQLVEEFKADFDRLSLAERAVLEERWCAMDSNKDGKIQLSEFINHFRRHVRTGQVPASLLKLFYLFDLDGKTSLSMHEAAALLLFLGSPGACTCDSCGHYILTPKCWTCRTCRPPHTPHHISGHTYCSQCYARYPSTLHRGHALSTGPEHALVEVDNQYHLPLGDWVVPRQFRQTMSLRPYPTIPVHHPVAATLQHSSTAPATLFSYTLPPRMAQSEPGSSAALATAASQQQLPAGQPQKKSNKWKIFLEMTFAAIIQVVVGMLLPPLLPAVMPLVGAVGQIFS